MIRNALIRKQSILLKPSTGCTIPSVLRYYSQSASPTAQELSAAREWLSNFTVDTIPKRLCEVSFSRSSGPGGQNVNKVSSKATLRLPLDEFLALVPPIFHSSIRASPCYAKKSDSILIQADDSRKQSENSHACLVRLHRLVADAGAAVLPGETSEEQKEHVRRLQNAEKERRIKYKKLQSSKKASRRGGGSND